MVNPQVRKFLSKCGKKGGKIGGKSTSERKRKASAENGKLGGRPKCKTSQGKVNK